MSDSVTFGWMIEGDDIVEGGINFEIWRGLRLG